MRFLADENNTCSAAWSREVRQFEIIIFISISLTIITLCISIFRKQYLTEHPKQAAIGLGVLGSIKVFLAIIVLSVLLPECPAGCQCRGYRFPHIYPITIMVIGILWMKRGYDYHKMAVSGVNGDANSNGDVEASRPAGDAEVV